MNSKRAKLTVNNGGSGSSTFRATLPTSWIRQMGLNEGTRNLKLEFDGTRITITNNEEEIEMLNKLMEKAIAEIEKEIKEMGFIDNSDNFERFIDVLAYDLTEEDEEIKEELVEMIEDYMKKNYKEKGNTNSRADYQGCYYESEEGYKKWKEIIKINE